VPSGPKPFEKISRPLAERLERLDPERPVRALVMVSAEDSPSAVFSARRPKGEERSRAARALRASAESVLPEIDRILERHRGKRLAETVNALGVVPVVSTVAGLRALAACGHVKAILEDQPISLLKK
jgi:hypothetical protein